MPIEDNYGTMMIVCMKHDKKYRSYIEWMLNQLRDDIVPKKYLARFPRILCACKEGNKRPLLEDPFEHVTDGEMTGSVEYLDNYIEDHIGSPCCKAIKRILGELRKDHEVEEELPTETHRNVGYNDAVVGPRSSAFRLLYLLQRMIEKDYSLLELPQRPKNVEDDPNVEMTLTFDLENFRQELIGSLIGERGKQTLPFMRRHKCRVEVKRLDEDGEKKVRVKITKRCQEMRLMDEIKKEYVEMARDVQKDEDDYQIEQAETAYQNKQLLRELLEKEARMGPDAKWQDIQTRLQGSDDLDYMRLDYRSNRDEQQEWFNELQQELWPKTANSGGNAAVAPAPVQAVQSSSAVKTEPLIAASAAPVAASAPPPVARADSTSQTATDGVHAAAATRAPSLCLVHDRRWMATFQYTLTQCFTHLKLPKKDGRTFTRLVCSCDGQDQDVQPYFPIPKLLSEAFVEVKVAIKLWPAVCQHVMLPLVNQLDKKDQSELWFSLVKFAFYYDNLRHGNFNCLKPGYVLPGIGKPWPAASAYRFTPLPMNSGAASLGGSGATSLGGSVVAQPSGSGVAQPSGSGGASMISAGGSSVSRGPATTKLSPAGPPKVTKDDWSDECYLHGTKKRGPFQLILNNLHKNSGLDKKYHNPFERSVCCCLDQPAEVRASLYPTDRKLNEECSYMKQKLEGWRTDGRSNIQSVIAALDEYLRRNTISEGLIKFIFYFHKAHTRDTRPFDKVFRNRKK